MDCDRMRLLSFLATLATTGTAKRQALTRSAARHLLAAAWDLRARVAERRQRFDAASQSFILAARSAQRGNRPAMQIRSLMRAASCLEKAQNWRAHTATWEQLARTIEGEIHGRSGAKIERDMRLDAPHKGGQHARFNIISYDSWDRGIAEYYADDQLATLKHQLAFAYTFAAEEAEASRRHVIAARYYRLASVAWEDSRWGDPDAKGGTEHAGDKYREAARCVYGAARCALESNEWVAMYRVTEGWEAYDLGYGSMYAEEARLSLEAPDGHGESDLQRLSRLWQAYRHSRPTAPGAVLSRSLAQEIRHVTHLQQLLAQRGDQREARHLYQRRRALESQRLMAEGKNLASRLIRLYLFLTGASSSFARTAVFAATVHLVLFPILYAVAFFSAIHISGDNSSSAVVEVTVFSMANSVGLATGRQVPLTATAAAVQAVQTMSAVAFAGYLLWISLRSYEEV